VGKHPLIAKHTASLLSKQKTMIISRCLWFYAYFCNKLFAGKVDPCFVHFMICCAILPPKSYNSRRGLSKAGWACRVWACVLFIFRRHCPLTFYILRQLGVYMQMKTWLGRKLAFHTMNARCISPPAVVVSPWNDDLRIR
jgi:hypothetical protein